MSRYIKSAQTLKARVGKQVKVDGTLCDVTERRGSIVFEAVDGGYHAEVDHVEAFLSDHDVATAGYKFKQTSKAIKGFILDQECRVTLKPCVGDFDDSSSHTVVGMLRFCKDHCGDKGYMLLTNDEHLRGDPAEDMKGYDWSWWFGFDERDLNEYVERTEPLEKAESDPEEKTYRLRKYDSKDAAFFIVQGVLYTDEKSKAIYLLSNDKEFDGGHEDVCKRSGTGYKFGWWLCDSYKDISGSMYKITEVKKEEPECAEGSCKESTKTDPLVRIAEALERIAKALEK